MSRTIVINEIISELEKITGDENIKRIRDRLKLALEVEKYDESIEIKKLPTAICVDKDKEIKEQVKDACKVIKGLEEAIRTRISPISGKNIPNTTQGNNLINSYRINHHQLNKYLALVYLLKEELIELDIFNELVGNLRENKIGGFNKHRRETRKNKSKRKKPKNKSKRKKPKNKSTRKTKQ